MRRIGRYEVLEELGRGSMGATFKARNPETGQLVSLKALSPPLTEDPDGIARQMAQAQVMLPLQHPNIVRTLEVFEDQGQVYVATEYVEGRTLTEAIRSGSVTPRQAVAVVEALAQALEYTHHRGILHRDLKPHNVIVTADGTPRLTDFLPVTPAEQSETTATGFFLGTPAYMAPEQFRDPKHVSPATDVYGLGGILYTALTGQPPVEGQRLSHMMMHAVSQEPPPPSQINPGVDANLDAICLKCLSKDPRQRYQSAAELADALHRLHGEAAPEANPAEQLRPVTRGGGSAPPRPAPASGTRGITPPPAREPSRSLEFRCPSCGAKLRVPEALTGKSVRCPQCAQVFVAGSISPTQPSAPMRAPARPRSDDDFDDARERPRRSRREESHEARPERPKQAGTPEMPGVTTDAVVFTVTSPPTFVPGTAAVIDVWAHLERHRAEVLDRARAEAGGEISSKSRGPVEVARGSVLTIKLHVQNLEIDEPEDTLLWRGDIGNATFAVRVPAGLTPGPRSGVAHIHVGGLRIARINFVVQVGPQKNGSDFLETKQERFHKAFASYATPDRDEVLARIQGIQKAAPTLDVFLDVVKLRSGQHWEGELFERINGSDVFYLFWSARARQSEWVEKEWRYALKTRGLDFIDPVPLAPPDEVPPPQELAEKHFNDWVLAFRRNRRKDSFFGGLLRRLGLRQ